MNRFRSILVAMAAMIMIVPGALAQTPEAGVQQTSVGGNAFEILEEGEAGAVSIIAFSPPNERTDSIGVVIRNNTDGVISGITVKAEIHGPDGKLVAVADISEFRGGSVQPGEIGIGLVLGSKVNDPALEITFKVTYDEGEEDDFMGKTGLEFTYTEWTGDRILGEFRNPSETTLENIYLSYACFDADGTLLGVEWGSAHGILNPGDTTTFQLGDYDPNMVSCTYHLVAGHGYEK